MLTIHQTIPINQKKLQSDNFKFNNQFEKSEPCNDKFIKNNQIGFKSNLRETGLHFKVLYFREADAENFWKIASSKVFEDTFEQIKKAPEKDRLWNEILDTLPSENDESNRLGLLAGLLDAVDMLKPKNQVNCTLKLAAQPDILFKKYMFNLFDLLKLDTKNTAKFYNKLIKSADKDIINMTCDRLEDLFNPAFSLEKTLNCYSELAKVADGSGKGNLIAYWGEVNMPAEKILYCFKALKQGTCGYLNKFFMLEKLKLLPEEIRAKEFVDLIKDDELVKLKINHDILKTIPDKDIEPCFRELANSKYGKAYLHQLLVTDQVPKGQIECCKKIFYEEPRNETFCKSFKLIDDGWFDKILGEDQ